MDGVNEDMFRGKILYESFAKESLVLIIQIVVKKYLIMDMQLLLTKVKVLNLKM